MKKPLSLFTLLIGLLSCQQRAPTPPLTKSNDYKRGESFLYKKNDSAFYYFNKAVASSKDSLQAAMAYNQMAGIQSDAGDYFGSQESLSHSLKFLDGLGEKARKCLASDYNELGMASFNLKNYNAAILYYGESLKFADNPKLIPVILNNRANAYQRNKNYSQALAIYSSAITRMPKDGSGYARLLSNMARTKWLADPKYNAGPELQASLRIRRQEGDLWGQNASYSHLSDYYAHAQPDSALNYARLMYAIARELESPDDQLEALQKLIRLAPPSEMRAYFESFQQLSDSVQSVRNAAKNQFALIRYDVEKNKTDNLKLQKDNAENKYMLFKQSILLYSTLLVSAGIVFFAFRKYRKKQASLKMEAEEAIRENQLRTSKKVHDVVANGLYRIMSEVENLETIDRENLLDDIEELYEQSRDISYEKPLKLTGPFHEYLKALIISFGSDSTKVVLAGNDEELWQGVSAEINQELAYVIQELLVNMKKHSQASSAALRFERKGTRINIYYTDNGVGFPPGLKYKNGLKNTGNRINSIRGAITFGTDAENGARVMVTFPIA